MASEGMWLWRDRHWHLPIYHAVPFITRAPSSVGDFGVWAAAAVSLVVARWGGRRQTSRDVERGVTPAP